MIFNLLHTIRWGRWSALCSHRHSARRSKGPGLQTECCEVGANEKGNWQTHQVIIIDLVYWSLHIVSWNGKGNPDFMALEIVMHVPIADMWWLLAKSKIYKVWPSWYSKLVACICHHAPTQPLTVCSHLIIDALALHRRTIICTRSLLGRCHLGIRGLRLCCSWGPTKLVDWHLENQEVANFTLSTTWLSCNRSWSYSEGKAWGFGNSQISYQISWGDVNSVKQMTSCSDF